MPAEQPNIGGAVHKGGTRADAETIGGYVCGGSSGDGAAFEMKRDRPFVFLIRDTITDALLFAGVVNDPTHN